jgi:hypothetical protein
VKYFLTFTLLWCIAPLAQAQINPLDSSVQAVVYWLKNDTAKYHCIYEKLNVTGKDTQWVFQMEYDVAVTVVDSTKEGYEVAWHYSPVKTASGNPLLDKITQKAYGITAKVKLDENGAFVELVNWKQIQLYMEEVFHSIVNEMPPTARDVLEQMKAQYASKSAVEESAIKYLIQLHYFYGLKYEMNAPIQVNSKQAHQGSADPLDATLTLLLEEMDVEEESYTLSMEEVINPEQLTAATINYLKQLAQKSGTPMDEAAYEGLQLDMYKRIVTVFHESGWPLYSLFRQVVEAENHQDIEVRTIELQ